METEYTNREIDFKFQGVHEKLDDILLISKEAASGVKETNGKVALITKWKEQVTGGIKVVIVVGLPLLVWGLSQVAKLDNQIREVVTDELSKYEIEK